MPFSMLLKCVKKLNDAMALTSACGAQPVKKLITTGKPAKMKIKHTTTATTNAITWFLVIAEMAEPTAKYAPAINKLPI